MTTAVDKWPACAKLLAVAQAGHLPTALTPLLGTRPIYCHKGIAHTLPVVDEIKGFDD